MGCEDSGGHGSTGVAFPRQESSGFRLRKGSDNQHVVGMGMWQGMGVGGGMASATAAVGNDVPHASRSAAAAFFAWMDVVVQWQGGGCRGDSGDDGSGNVIVLAAIAGIGWHNESRWGEEEDAVTTAAAMLLHG